MNGSGSGTTSGDEEWRNIHTMLSCISGMVEKTKRAISILQHRGSDGGPITHQETTMISDIKRQTEEKIAEFRRNAEDAVNQVSLNQTHKQKKFSLCQHKSSSDCSNTKGETTSGVGDSTSGRCC